MCSLLAQRGGRNDTAFVCACHAHSAHNEAARAAGQQPQHFIRFCYRPHHGMYCDVPVYMRQSAWGAYVEVSAAYYLYCAAHLCWLMSSNQCFNKFRGSLAQFAAACSPSGAGHVR
jgi:hypothetical protein